MTETFYEIIETFVLGFFPSAIQTSYADVIELMVFLLTVGFFWYFLIVPLYRLAMYIMPKKGR